MTWNSRRKHTIKTFGLITSIAILQLSSSVAYAQKNTQTMGNGLLAEYKSGTNTVKQTDPVIDFNWGTGAPLTGFPADNFTVTWTGQIAPPVSGSYTFDAKADDSLRVWVDGKLMIDSSKNVYPDWLISPFISLNANQKYDIRVEYAEKTGNAAVQLCWRYLTKAGQFREVIPQNRMYSPSTGGGTIIVQTLPSAPINLTAVGQWRTSCCNGKPMAHAELSWSMPTSTPIPIKTFNVYRDGVLIQTGLTETSWEDMSVSSGQAYKYEVTGVAANNTESLKSASAVAVAPFPATAWTAPLNLRVRGTWLASEKCPTDVLTWDDVSGAVRYNIYQYDKLIGSSTTGASFLVPAASFYPSMTYAVTAVDANGDETLPSNIVASQGSNNPAVAPTGIPRPPQTPISLKAATEWNVGSPRVRLTWIGAPDVATCNIYRDGIKVATGVWGQIWFDTNVRVGEKHEYKVSGVNVHWIDPVESQLSEPIQAVVASQPIVNPATKVTITKVIPNDDSAIIYFNAVPGATDYRAYDLSKPGSYKYSGGSLSIEMNGLTPGTPANVVIEAVDKLGPFQRMDGMIGPGAVTHEGHMNMAINGLGDPSNVPTVIAGSEAVSINCQPRVLTGSQVFFDTFRNSTPFKPAAVPAGMLAANADEVAAVENDKWTIFNVRGDLDNSRSFVMSNHFMDTFFDGGTPGSGEPLHISKASLVMQPKSFADISGGKVLHVTFEVDAHFSIRRWCDVIIAGAEDTLLNPGAFVEGNQLPTVTGRAFRWQILPSAHGAEVFSGKDANGNLVTEWLMDQANGVGPDNFGPPSRNSATWSDMPVFNGTIQDLDKRHRFDLYLSQNRFQIREEGKIVKDKVFPKGVQLPFNRAAIYFVHQTYHSALERNELLMFYGIDSYWINHRPYSDERHWDNMGFEVLNTFPASTIIMSDTGTASF